MVYLELPAGFPGPPTIGQSHIKVISLKWRSNVNYCYLVTCCAWGKWLLELWGSIALKWVRLGFVSKLLYFPHFRRPVNERSVFEIMSYIRCTNYKVDEKRDKVKDKSISQTSLTVFKVALELVCSTLDVSYVRKVSIFTIPLTLLAICRKLIHFI